MPGKAAALGIDYEVLAKRNPRLIHCSITAYGRDNPHSDRPGYDALVAARTGLQWEQRGWPEGAEYHISGEEGFAPDFEVPYEWVQGPHRPGPVFSASRWPSSWRLLCLRGHFGSTSRARPDRRQLVEISFQGALAAGWAVWQRVERPDTPHFATSVFCSRSPKGHFLTSDKKWIHRMGAQPSLHGRGGVARLAARPEREVRSQSPGHGRRGIDHHDLPSEEMVEHAAMRDFEFWVEAGRIAKMPLQVCRPVEEALNDPWMLADGCVQEREVPGLGTIREAGHAYTLSLCDPKTPGTVPPERAPSRTSMKRPLEGIRVVDFGMAVAGPYGTQLLSDLGADVIKVGTLIDAYWHQTSVAATCNRGKRSIPIDLKDPKAKDDPQAPVVDGRHRAAQHALHGAAEASASTTRA